MLKLNHVFLYAWTLGSHCIAYDQNTNFYHKLTHIYSIYMITSKMLSYGFPYLSTFLKQNRKQSMTCAHFWLDDKASKRAKPSLPSKPFKANRHRVMRFGSIRGNEKRMYRPGPQKKSLLSDVSTTFLVKSCNTFLSISWYSKFLWIAWLIPAARSVLFGVEDLEKHNPSWPCCQAQLVKSKQWFHINYQYTEDLNRYKKRNIYTYTVETKHYHDCFISTKLSILQ